MRDIYPGHFSERIPVERVIHGIGFHADRHPRKHGNDQVAYLRKPRVRGWFSARNLDLLQTAEKLADVPDLLQRRVPLQSPAHPIAAIRASHIADRRDRQVHLCSHRLLRICRSVAIKLPFLTG